MLKLHLCLLITESDTNWRCWTS